MTYFQGDNFQAFDRQPITIDLEDEQDKEEVKTAYAVFNDGIVVKKYENPTFPIEVELVEVDTKKLPYKCYLQLVVIDKQDRPKTCDGVLYFTLEKEVKYESNI